LDKEITKFFIENYNNHLDSDHIHEENQSINLNRTPVKCFENKQIAIKTDSDFEYSSTLKSFKFPESHKVVPI
jgi:hypothetical protein